MNLVKNYIRIGISLIPLFFGITSGLQAQVGPVYGHFFINPFVYNPGYVGSDEAVILDLNHRMQLTGIEGSPQTSTITFQTPLNYALALGINIHTDERSIFKSTAGTIAAGYRIGLGDNGSNYVRFGLGAKIDLQALDLSEVDPSDPVFFNANINSLRLDALFGLKIHLSGLSLGASLPSLLNPQLVSQESFVSPGLDPLKYINFMASYQLEASEGKIVFEPHFIYHMNDSFPDQFEAAAVLKLNNVLSLGGGYRQEYGITGYVGLTIQDKYYVGYGYEPGTKFVSNLVDGTHEIHLRIKLKDKKLKEENTTQDLLDQIRLKDKDDLHKSRFKNLSEEEIYLIRQSEQISRYQVAVKYFKTFKEADSWAIRLRKQRLDANVEYEAETKQFYVYLYETENIKAAEKLRSQLSKNKQYKDARVIKVD